MLFLQLLTGFLILLVIFVHQSTVYEYARRKGYEGIKPGLIGLIPIYGLIHYQKAQKKRNVSDSGLKEVFKLNHMFQRVLLYIEIVLVAAVVIVPVVYIFGLAFSNIRSDIPNQIWPENPNFEAFNYLFTETKFTTWYWNTLSIALINMFIGTVLITGAAYVFATFSFKGKRAGLLGILVLQAFPSFMGLIAMYVLFGDLDY